MAEREMQLGCLPPSSATAERFSCEGYRSECIATRNSRPQPAVLPDIELFNGKWYDWRARDQQPRNTCVAFAVAYCVELIMATKNDVVADGKRIEKMSPQFLYFEMRTSKALKGPDLPPGYAEGATRLDQARGVLLEAGICTEELQPYVQYQNSLEGEEPTQFAYIDAKKRLFDAGYYCLYSNPNDRPPDLSRRLHKRLSDGLPNRRWGAGLFFQQRHDEF